jgi:uncharacterized membrane protein YecN with MAPEG domain
MLPPFAVTPLYAALCGLLLLALSLRVIRLRGRYRTTIGDGGHAALQGAVRAQGNCAEYAPLALLLLFLLELTRQPVWALHLLGALLFVGRVLHALALSGSSGPSLPRTLGMTLTFASLSVTSVWLLVVVQRSL